MSSIRRKKGSSQAPNKITKQQARLLDGINRIDKYIKNFKKLPNALLPVKCIIDDLLGQTPDLPEQYVKQYNKDFKRRRRNKVTPAATLESIVNKI